MNNQEAAEILTAIKNTPCITWTNGADIALDLAIKALEERDRPTCMTCKYKGCYVTEKPCKECSHAWVDKYEEAENDSSK